MHCTNSRHLRISSTSTHRPKLLPDYYCWLLNSWVSALAPYTLPLLGNTSFIYRQSVHRWFLDHQWGETLPDISAWLATDVKAIAFAWSTSANAYCISLRSNIDQVLGNRGCGARFSLYSSTLLPSVHPLHSPSVERRFLQPIYCVVWPPRRIAHHSALLLFLHSTATYAASICLWPGL